MATYGSMVITQEGQNVYAQVQSGATLTFTSMAIGGGELTTTLTAALTSGTAYTSLAVAALTSPVASGQTLTLGAQTITASAAAAIGATTIAVTSFTASANYAVGAIVTLVADPATLTALLNPIASITINKILVSGNTATVYGVYQNTGLAVSTYTCEIGLFATDPATGNPVLYGYANAGTQGDTFPPASQGAFSRQFAIAIAIGSAASVTADTPSLVYGALSQANDWQAEQTFAAGITGTGSVGALTVPWGNVTSAPTFVTASEVGAASGVASLDATGNVPANELGNVPAVADASATTAGIVKTAVTPAASPAAAVITNPSGAALQAVAGPMSMQSVAATMTGTSGRFVGATDGAPTAGTYGVGDYADDPTNGAFWICTVAGTPGTWVKASPASATPSTAGVVEIAASPTSGAPQALIANTAATQTMQGPLALTDPLQAPTNPNLLPNPTFAQGDAWWGSLAASASIQFGTDGEGGFIQMTDGADSTPTGHSIQVPMAAGNTFTLSADIDSSGVASGQVADVLVNYLNASGGTISSVPGPEATAGTSWSRYSATLTAPTGCAFVTIEPAVYAGTSATTYAAWRRIKLEAGSVATMFSDDQGANPATLLGAPAFSAFYPERAIPLLMGTSVSSGTLEQYLQAAFTMGSTAYPVYGIPATASASQQYVLEVQTYASGGGVARAAIYGIGAAANLVTVDNSATAFSLVRSAAFTIPPGEQISLALYNVGGTTAYINRATLYPQS